MAEDILRVPPPLKVNVWMYPNSGCECLGSSLPRLVNIWVPPTQTCEYLGVWG